MDEVYISWGRRLLYCPGLVSLKFQVLILRLLADYPEDQAGLLYVVHEIGGVKELFLRFFGHYTVSFDVSMCQSINLFSLLDFDTHSTHNVSLPQATSPFTLWELGFNFNHTKPLMRLLRNRGILVAMPTQKKIELALWLLNCSYGDLAFKTHYFGRADMHRLVKEAFVCLAESCTRDELDQVISRSTTLHYAKN